MGKKIVSFTMALLLVMSVGAAESKMEKLLDVFGYKTVYHRDAMQEFGMKEADVRKFYKSFDSLGQILKMFGMADSFDELGEISYDIYSVMDDSMYFPLQREVAWTWTEASRRYAESQGTTIVKAFDDDVMALTTMMENLLSTAYLQEVLSFSQNEAFTAKTNSVPNKAYSEKIERLFAANKEIEQLANAIRIGGSMLGFDETMLKKAVDLTNSEFAIRASSIYMDMFTADEIDELIRLYQSPAGRKLVAQIEKRQSAAENMSIEDLFSGKMVENLQGNPEDFASLCTPVMRKYQAAYPFLYAKTMISMKKSIENLRQ